MKWITVKTAPIVFFMGGLAVSLISVIVIALLRVSGLTNISILAASSIFGLVIIVTLVWYLILFFMGKLKFNEPVESDFSPIGSATSIDDDDDWA